MAVEWTNSADKHEIDREDAMHAIENAYHYEKEFDEPRVPGKSRPWLFIGPPRQLGGPLLEVMVEVIPPDDLVIFHVMEARQKHLDRMTE
ncbi:hypothetical protein [Rhodococcoides corynebacterioides]|uniref:hypothetical protein n=1 Tax=Rhodococcoides corynebacterioides TaxID=53972 RepID=UPI001C9ACD7E|nr:hypothetical protein [Rhodococcus corynebacterioides]MBY6352028.1 hypothetical protein [Rhodococcus corynebacterioides]